MISKYNFLALPFLAKPRQDTAVCQKIAILCLSESKHRRIWSSSHQANQTDWQKIQEANSEKLSTFYLMQQISIAIQKGNAVCVRGCPKKLSPGIEVVFNFHVQEAKML
jgi:hypothetical protein